MTLPIQDQLDAIFAIPKDGSNIKEEADDSQETSYAEVIVADEKVAFEQKAHKVKEQLAKDAPPVNVVYASKTEEKVNVQSQPASPIPVPAAPIPAPKDEFEKILSQSIRPEFSVPEEVQPVVSQPNNADLDSEHIEEEKATVQNGDHITTPVLYDQKPDSDGWCLTAPSPMFNRFYEEKSSFIRHITKNGRPIDIDKLTTELTSSTVSTNIELTDMRGMADKLTRIQDLLDRVVHIKIQATSQCAAAKRGVELLRGVLAKVTYEKPAARQDGVIYDHMKDIEMYASRLESLEQNAKDVYHNLLEAKEILSRKISIALELVKEQNRTEGLESKFNSLPENAKKAVVQASSAPSRLANEGYDRLEVQEAVKTAAAKPKDTPKKSGQLSWLD